MLSSSQILLLVDQSKFDLWKAAVVDMKAEHFRVVAVASGISRSNTANTLNNGKYACNHQEIQKALQNPYYKIDDGKETNLSPIDDVTRITEILSSRYQHEIHKGEVVYDFTGRWREICSNLSECQLSENKSSPPKGFCTVALRPDGHVAGIFEYKNSSSLTEVKQYIQNIRTSLYLC